MISQTQQNGQISLVFLTSQQVAFISNMFMCTFLYTILFKRIEKDNSYGYVKITQLVMFSLAYCIVEKNNK